MLQCEDCGKESEDVVEEIDPYIQEKLNEVEYITVCKDCLYERILDI